MRSWRVPDVTFPLSLLYFSFLYPVRFAKGQLCLYDETSRAVCDAQIDAFPFLSTSALVWEDDFMGVWNVVLVSCYLRQIQLNKSFLPLPTTNVTFSCLQTCYHGCQTFLLAFFTCRDSKSTRTRAVDAAGLFHVMSSLKPHAQLAPRNSTELLTGAKEAAGSACSKACGS